jgi:uncharacterized membrane protein HdeD (DUF308 family)
MKMASAEGLLAKAGADAQALCKRTWWVFLIGGIAAVVFGVLAFMQPLAGWVVLSIFFAASVLVDGAFNAWGAITNREKDGWWLMLLIGGLGIGVGLYALLNPPLAMMAFVLIVAFQAVLLGVLLVMLGIKVRKVTDKEWLLYLTGGLSVLFGMLIVLNPGAGAISIVYIVAAWAIITGLLKVFFSFRIKNLPERIAERRAA